MQKIIDIVHELPKHATKRWATRAAPVDCFCVHHSATRADVSIEAIARYHVVDKDMPSIQYHYVITAEGAIYQTQPDDLFVWHGNDWNTGLGVCLLGDFTTAHPPEAQLAAARWLLAEKRRQYGELRLVGHKEAPRASTECPGDTWEQWKGELERIEEDGLMTATSKLGVFFQGNPELGTEATELVRDSKIRWVKGIDPDRWPTPAKNMFPGKRILARFWIGGDGIEEQYVLRGVTGADEYANLLAPRWAAAYAQGVRDVVGPNEMHPAPDTIARHVDFWQRWAERVVFAGMCPWFGSFGVGWPDTDVEQIVTYRPVARYCAEHGGGMEVHEYSAPSVLDGDGWYTLRYRRTIAQLGFEVPVFIGECGIDWGVVPGQKNTGWKSHKEYVYPEQYGLPSGLMTEERYWRQLSAYDDELLKDNYVVAAVPFVTCPEASWATFDFGGPLIRRVVTKHAAGTAEPEPEPELPIVGPTDEAIRNAGWNALGVAYNPAAAFQAYAREHGLGAPLRDEHDVDGVRMQEFMGGIVYAPIGWWDKTTHTSW